MVRAEGKAPITALALTPAGNGFVHGSQAGAFHRSFADKNDVQLPCELENVCALAFSADGKFLAVAGGTPGETGRVDILDWPGKQRVARLDGHTDLVHAVGWLPDGKRLATGSADRSVRLWDRGRQMCLATLTGHSGAVLALAISADGQWLCTGSADQSVRVWSVAEQKLVRSLNNHLGAVTALAFRPAQEATPRPYLASASLDGSVRIWQPTIGRMVRIVRHAAPVQTVAWSAEGQHLFSAAQDDRLRQIDGDSDEIRAERALDGGRISSLALRGPGALIVGQPAGRIREFQINK